MRAPPVSTRVTRLLRCEYPLMLPGMSWISRPELVAAVCNAGGVGILATGPLTPDETRAGIRRVRSLLKDEKATFGIGATLLMPGATENAQVALEEEVPLINTSLGKAEWIADGLQAYSGTLLATVTNQTHAQAAVDAGADALLVTGHEAAAHGGDVTSLVLIPSLAEAFPDTPLVAAGGFASGAGLAAALTLGADAVAMGSRLAVTWESPLADNAKQHILASNESDTLYGANFDGIHARVLKTSTTQDLMRSRPWFPTIIWRALQASRELNVPLYKILGGVLTQYDKIFVMAQFGAATQRLTRATMDGDLDEGVQFVGQSQGLINDEPAVDDLVQRIMKEAHSASLRTSTILGMDDRAVLERHG